MHRTLLPLLLALSTAPLQAAPVVDHHQHLLSPAGTTFLNFPREAPELPAGVAALLDRQEQAWNQPEALKPLLAGHASIYDPWEREWHEGDAAVADFLGHLFGRPYDILPVDYVEHDGRGRLVAWFTRGDGDARAPFGSVSIDVERSAAGAWTMASLFPTFPGPTQETPIDGDAMVALLDEGGVRKAVLLSVGYWFQSPNAARFDPALAQAEDAWTAEQAAKHPDRLVAFCSLNPLHAGADASLAQCVRDRRFKGIKLHFASSDVDPENPDHLAKLKALFARANAAGLALVVHLRHGDAYGAKHAQRFLDELLPSAPDVPVQLAHLWGGAAYSPEALRVFAGAMKARHPATRHLYFDVADTGLIIDRDTQGEEVATALREIGLDRILFGSDAAYGDHPGPKGSWEAFEKAIPLTPDEFADIADNVAPYLR